MRTRILEIVDTDGASIYVPQHKFLWWWANWHGFHGERIEFTCIERARRWLTYRRNAREIVHEI